MISKSAADAQWSSARAQGFWYTSGRNFDLYTAPLFGQGELMEGKILTGKVALVTGGSRGIGAAISAKLAALGAHVAINFRSDAESARQVAEEIRRGGGSAQIFAADVADPAAVKAMVAAVAEAFGRIDIVVNNAGSFGARPFGTIDAAFFAEQFNANALSTVLVTQEAVAHFPPSGGHVVNVSSNLAFRSVADGTSIYAAAKAAVATITQCFGRELGKRKITVNAVAPGVTETRMTAELLAESRQAIIDDSPMGRIGRPADIAEVVAFLASDACGWMTGRTVIVDGGTV
jgi:3-oxoacyl-[acyl-carrier protein] reductase